VKELAARDATGAIATIYDDIKRFCAIPYVSSMQRHLATRPGWLEWVWAALRPAFASGHAQTSAWRASEGLVVPRLAPIPRDGLRVWGTRSLRAPTIPVYRTLDADSAPLLVLDSRESSSRRADPHGAGGRMARENI
jgi:hypothetical protein